MFVVLVPVLVPIPLFVCLCRGQARSIRHRVNGEEADAEAQAHLMASQHEVEAVDIIVSEGLERREGHEAAVEQVGNVRAESERLKPSGHGVCL
jgi:hypothetical protein